MIRKLFFTLALVTTSLSPVMAEPASEPNDAILILDGSGSMWARMDGEPRIVVAKKVLTELLDELPQSTRLGLMAYGHTRKGDCEDIEMLVDVGGERERIKEAIDKVSPKGKTPMTDAVIQAAEELKYTENPATVILVSDGEETCNVNPCEAASRLDELGVDLKVHTVGFALEEGSEGLEQLQCMANNTGGKFFATQNAEELATALTSITQEEAEGPQEFDATFNATDGADGPTITEGLIWAIYEADSDAPQDTSNPTGTFNTTLTPGDYTVSVLRISDETSTEKSFTVDDGDTDLTLVLESEAAIDIEAPETVVYGSNFDVTWSEALDNRDIVTIVPADTEDGKRAGGNQYFRVGDKTSGSLVAPASPGLYEVRYLQDKGHKTLGSQAVEVVEQDITLDVPESAIQGSSFNVFWSKAIHHNDIVTIVPADTEDGKRAGGNQYFRVGDKSSGALTAPADPGLYEVRYLLNQGQKTITAQAIEVVEQDITLDVPESATQGSTFNVSWSKAMHRNDVITIVPADTEDGKRAGGNQYFRVGDKSSGALTAPADPGLYEVRYLLNQGQKTITAQAIEVVEQDITLELGRDVIRAGDDLTVSWSDAIHRNDVITIVPVGTEEGKRAGGRYYFRVGDKTSGKLTAPDDTGLYEVRYLLNTGAKLMAAATVEVVEEDAPLDDGSGLQAPDTASPGETIEVSWGRSSEGDERIALAKANQPDFSWIRTDKTADSESKTLELTLPEESGIYEIRYLDITNREVLGRVTIQVK